MGHVTLNTPQMGVIFHLMFKIKRLRVMLPLSRVDILSRDVSYRLWDIATSLCRIATFLYPFRFVPQIIKDIHSIFSVQRLESIDY